MAQKNGQLSRMAVTWGQGRLSLKRILYPSPHPTDPDQRPSQHYPAEALVRGPRPSLKPSPGANPGRQNRPLQPVPTPTSAPIEEES